MTTIWTNRLKKGQMYFLLRNAYIKPTQNSNRDGSESYYMEERFNAANLLFVRSTFEQILSHNETILSYNGIIEKTNFRKLLFAGLKITSFAI